MKKLQEKESAKDIIKIAIIDKPDTFNPLAIKTMWDESVINLVYDTLAIGSSKSPYFPEPWLAQKWEWDKSGHKLRIILRNNIKWHDGTKFTAEDVKFSYEILKEFEVPQFLGSIFFIEEIAVVDDSTIDFTLSEPRATFIPITLCNIRIIPKHLWKSIVEKARYSSAPRETLVQYTNKTPIGTGPFKFINYDQKGNSIQLEANKEFFTDSPHIDGIQYKIYSTESKTRYKYLDEYASEEQAHLALRKGDVDYIACHYPLHLVLGLHQNPEPKISTALHPTNGFVYLAFNCRKKPFNDVEFRNAIDCLVDRESYCKYLYHGQSTPIYTLIPANEPYWSNPNVTKYGEGLTREERQKKARAILTNADYVCKDGTILMPNKEPLRELKIVTDERIMNRKGLAMAIALWLREIGIPATIQTKSIEEIRKLELGLDHDFDMLLSEYWFNLPLDPDYLCTFFHSSQSERGLNSAGYENPIFDELAILQRQEIDIEKRKILVWEMQDILSKDKPWIPLSSNIRIEFYRNDIYEGWISRPLGFPAYNQIWSYLNLRRV